MFVFQVRWNFILFQTCLLKLIQYVNRITNVPYYLVRSEKGTSKIGYGHMAFWANADVIPLQQVMDILDREKELAKSEQYNNAGFITQTEVTTSSARDALSPVEYILPAGAKGASYAATHGPVGERVEIAYRSGAGYASDTGTRPFCQNEGVLPLMLSPLVNNSLQVNVSQMMAGFHHVGITVRDFDTTYRFYTEVLGGISAARVQGIPGNPELKNALFQQDLIEASNQGVSPNENFGICDVSSPTKGSFDIGFILFDNIYFEPYGFHCPPGQTPGPRYNYNNTSPAHLGTFQIGFWVKEDVNFNQYIYNMESEAGRRGMSMVKANRVVNVGTLGDKTPLSNYSKPMTSGDLAGYNYAYVKGPSGEQLVFTQFTGLARNNLREAMLEYGSVSKAFPETDPWQYGGFSTYCDDILPLY